MSNEEIQTMSFKPNVFIVSKCSAGTGPTLDTDGSVIIRLQDGGILKPGSNYTGNSKVHVKVPMGWMASIHVKSKLALKNVDIAARRLPPGFDGEFKIQLVNNGQDLILLEPGQEILRLCFVPCLPSENIIIR